MGSRRRAGGHHAKAALSLKVNKTDANDALGLAQIMRVGWFRKVPSKVTIASAATSTTARKAGGEFPAPLMPM